MLSIVRKPGNARQQAGFTIIELLIATAVFSVLLVIVSTAIVRFTAEYYKGVNTTNTQNTAQAIINTISQDIQFSPAGSIQTGGGSSFCVGGHEYMYRLFTQVSDASPPYANSEGPHALIENAAGSGCGVPAGMSVTSATLPTGVRELVGLHMRLANLQVMPLGSGPVQQLYQIKVRVVYGDDDLLCSPMNADCNLPGMSMNLTAPDLSCKTQTGSQYCAVSDLSTIVEKRI